ALRARRGLASFPTRRSSDLPQAVRAIREMRPGDRVFVYHSGGVSGIVGLATARSEPRDDPKNAKSAVVELEFDGRLEPPTTLARSEEHTSELQSRFDLVCRL